MMRIKNNPNLSGLIKALNLLANRLNEYSNAKNTSLGFDNNFDESKINRQPDDPDLIVEGNAEKPNYFNFMKRVDDDKNTIVLLELSERKDNYEIVNLHWIGNDARLRKDKKKKKLKREDDRLSQRIAPSIAITVKRLSGRRCRFSAVRFSLLNLI